MKIGKLLLTAVIALGLMACNNEEGPDLSAGKDATITIKVLPSSSTDRIRHKATKHRQTVQIERFERFFCMCMADKKDRK